MKDKIQKNIQLLGYLVITKIGQNKENLNVSVLYGNVKEYEEITQSILEINSKENRYCVTYNTSLIKAQGSGFSDSTMKAIYLIGTILSVIIVVTSVFCIRNSFVISILEKMKTYGMFASIGATPKQIKKSVLFEGFILGIIGIIFGLILGILASFILVILVNQLMGDNIASKMVFNMSIYGILISIMLSCITIYLSCIGSARKASKASEIETIKLNNNIKYKKIKENKLITKLFGVSGNISYKNMKRNKSKFRVTIISIAICVLTFITMSTFLDLGFKSLNDTYKNVGFNVMVSNFDDSENESVIYDKTAEELLKMDNIEKYAYYRKTALDEKSLENSSIHTVAVGKEEYLRFVEKLGLDYEEVKDKGLLYNTYIMDFNNEKQTTEKYFDDNITSLNVSNFSKENTENIDINIKMIDKLPMGFELNYIDAPIMILSDEMFDKIYNNLKLTHIDHELYIQSDNAKELTKELNEYKKENAVRLYVANIEESVKQMQNVIILVSILLYGFIGVITLIGVTNIFNTITTSMSLRRKEFAIMQSIGMTKKELSNMMFFESILYGLKSLVFGLPLGILGSYLMFKATKVSSGASRMIGQYELPLGSIAISIIFTFIIIVFIMKLSLSKINKQNIIETIRNENI